MYDKRSVTQVADNKEYVTCPDEMGNIHISEEVLAVIAAAAAIEVEGVSGLAAQVASEIGELLGKKHQAKGVRVHMNEGVASLDLSILIQYGATIPEVARKVQDAVMTAVESTSGLTVEAVNIHVGGVTFPKEQKRAR